MDTTINVTLVWTESGQSETIPVAATSTKLSELSEWATALFGIDCAVTLFKDGRPLSPPTATLAQVEIGEGDLIAVQRKTRTVVPPPPQPRPQPTALPPAAGGLDFSNLLAGNNIAAPPAAAAAAPAGSKPPVYYPGMNLDEAMMHNPHPTSFVTLLLEKEHLMKELNYHNPRLASKFRQPGMNVEKGATIWREEMVKGGIQSAMKASERYHKETTLKKRLEQNPNDEEAKAYFKKLEGQKLIDQQYRQMMEEYPEALGRVLMLYIEAKINGHAIQAFCDSGAQNTIMSKRVAIDCGLGHLIDERFAGTAVGVGTGKILGRIHMVQMQIKNTFFPCSVTVMDDPPPGANEMPFLLGLDMMKRHLCQMDFAEGVIKFRLAPGEYMTTPFLHEKDLDEKQGGTRGFNADKANQELMKQMEKDEESDAKDESSKKS